MTFERVARSASAVDLTTLPESMPAQHERNVQRPMKSSVIPPQLSANLEAVTQPGGTLQASFYERGTAAWEHYRTTGVSSSSSDVLAKLQAKLDAKRKQLGG